MHAHCAEPGINLQHVLIQDAVLILHYGARLCQTDLRSSTDKPYAKLLNSPREAECQIQISTFPRKQLIVDIFSSTYPVLSRGRSMASNQPKLLSPFSLRRLNCARPTRAPKLIRYKPVPLQNLGHQTHEPILSLPQEKMETWSFSFQTHSTVPWADSSEQVSQISLLAQASLVLCLPVVLCLWLENL